MRHGPDEMEDAVDGMPHRVNWTCHAAMYEVSCMPGHPMGPQDDAPRQKIGEDLKDKARYADMIM